MAMKKKKKKPDPFEMKKAPKSKPRKLGIFDNTF